MNPGAHTSQLHWAGRWLLFVGIITSMVGIYCHFGTRALPPLRSEPPSFLLIPMTVISGTVSVLVFPALCGMAGRSRRILVLYGGFLVTLVAYGLYLWVVVPGGTPWLILMALLAGHLYGIPLFFAILVTQRFLLSPLLAPIRSERRSSVQ